tara:strand:- start:276 stop:1700 length:1425 start_codon:yes stop_codon:yes gene_type:complete
MTLCKRIIARLDVKGKKLIKGVSFEGVRVIGEPNELAKQYSKEGADELLYIDAVASLYGRNSISDILKIASNEIFIPITASGGIRSVSDARNLLLSGADKIALNTAGLKNPNLIKDLVETFGSQCIVISIQARKKYGEKQWEAMCEMGREKSGKDVFEWINEVQQLGAGEILLTSVDRDGTLSTPDHDLIENACKLTKIPLIVSGGLTKTSDIKTVLKNKFVSGVALGGCLHYKKQSINLLKKDLIKEDINLRGTFNLIKNSVKKEPLKNIKIGIINYGMGNQQSLVNTLEHLGAKPFISNNKNQLNKADILALPGVGAFPKGMQNLKELNLDSYIKKKVSEETPLLGICLGMQMLFENSSEFGLTEGLNLIKGNVMRIKSKDIKLPHMGWNYLIPKNNKINSSNNLNQYFVHSYAAYNTEPENIIYECNYEKENFVVGVQRKNIIGLQFHPERSGFSGINLLSELLSNLINKK